VAKKYFHFALSNSIQYLDLTGMDKILELKQSPAIPTFETGLTTGRPQICFVAWGPVPDEHDVPLRVGQTGFHLANDGIAAHEILIEGFEIEPGVWAGGSMISRIREKGEGFAFVSLRGIRGFAFYTEKWDLLRYMAAAAAKKPASQISQIEHRVKVRAIYRDGFNIWYRSQADLIYIPTQNRLTFGPTTQQRCGTHSEREALLKLAECPPDDSRPATAPGGTKKRGRGRPAQIDVIAKEAAREARERGGTWKEAAMLLYSSPYPSVQQVKNAPNVLKNYRVTRVPPDNS
jgi:hypothetical protein